MNAPAQGRIVVATCHDGRMRQVREMGEDLHGVPYFPGLFYGDPRQHGSSAINKVAYADDLARLANILLAEETKVVVIGFAAPIISFSVVKVARFMLMHAGIESVVVGVAKSRGQYYSLDILELNKEGVEPVHSYKHLGEDAVLHRIVSHAREIRKRIENQAEAA